MSAQPDFWNDQERAQKLNKERVGLEKILEDFRAQDKALEEGEVLLELGLEEGDGSVESELEEVVAKVEPEVARLELRRMMSGEYDHADAIVTIQAGAGGTDAQDWAEMLLRMYLRWAERAGFEVEEADLQPGEEAGIKGATLFIRGDHAFGWLRAESGVHRLVRISPFDANARRQTAFAAVTVDPELDDDIDIDIDWAKEVREDTLRSSGAGGQHVNKTESAIRLTHLDTGIVVNCQSERSQHKNRASARKIMMARLLEYKRAEQEEERAKIAAEKLKIEWGSQIRSYVNHPYRMVKDHRTSHETSQFDAVLEGQLDPFMEAYLLASSKGELTTA
jgi:peptide chain release factor 2